MPIKVTCQCGKSFAAKDELAGKAVKCPNCQQPLRIPAAGLAAPLPSAAPMQQQAATPPAGAPAMGGGSAFDEIGLKAAPAGAMLCPGCTQPLPPNAVLCVKCGYNLKLGRRMETVRYGDGGGIGGPGHGAVTADLMGKAAMSIEEEREAERSKTKEGMPWWVYLIALLIVSGFVILMMVIPQNSAITVAGLTLFGLGQIVNLYAQIRILIIAFNESVVQGLLCLLVPLYSLIYIITRWEKCGGYFLMSLGAGFVAGMGLGALMIAGRMQGGEEDAYLWPERKPPIVLSICEADRGEWRNSALDDRST
jgi:hypothetical protein